MKLKKIKLGVNMKIKTYKVNNLLIKVFNFDNKFKTKTFKTQNSMIRYISNYYKNLTTEEYWLLWSIYRNVEDISEGLNKELINEFKDFDIYRVANGDWFISRINNKNI